MPPQPPQAFDDPRMGTGPSLDRLALRTKSYQPTTFALVLRRSGGYEAREQKVGGELWKQPLVN